MLCYYYSSVVLTLLLLLVPYKLFGMVVQRGQWHWDTESDWKHLRRDALEEWKESVGHRWRLMQTNAEVLGIVKKGMAYFKQ